MRIRIVVVPHETAARRITGRLGVAADVLIIEYSYQQYECQPST